VTAKGQAQQRAINHGIRRKFFNDFSRARACACAQGDGFGLAEYAVPAIYHIRENPAAASPISLRVKKGIVLNDECACAFFGDRVDSRNSSAMLVRES
jgi:hypothetical protein